MVICLKCGEKKIIENETEKKKKKKKKKVWGKGGVSSAGSVVFQSHANHGCHS